MQELRACDIIDKEL